MTHTRTQTLQEEEKTVARLMYERGSNVVRLKKTGQKEGADTTS